MAKPKMTRGLNSQVGWVSEAELKKRAFSHSPQDILKISDESSKAFWGQVGAKNIESMLVLSQGASLYDFCINYSEHVNKNHVIVLINDFRKELANNWIARACPSAEACVMFGSSRVPPAENTLSKEFNIVHISYLRHPLDPSNDESFFWVSFDRSVFTRNPTTSYAPSGMKIEMSTDLTALRYLASLKAKDIKIWGMDFFETEYFSHSCRTLRKKPNEKEKLKGRLMKPEFIKLVKEFPESNFTLNTYAKFENDLSFKNLLVNKLN